MLRCWLLGIPIGFGAHARIRPERLNIEMGGGGVAFGREVEVAGGYGESLAQFRRRLDKAENHMNSNEAAAEDDCESLSRLCACMRQCFAMIVAAGGGRIPKWALSNTMRGRCPALAADLVFGQRSNSLAWLPTASPIETTTGVIEIGTVPR